MQDLDTWADGITGAFRPLVLFNLKIGATEKNINSMAILSDRGNLSI